MTFYRGMIYRTFNGNGSMRNVAQAGGKWNEQQINHKIYIRGKVPIYFIIYRVQNRWSGTYYGREMS